MFEAIAERLLSMIHKEEPIALSCLSDCLWIIQRSESVTKEQIRRTAKHRIEANDEVSRKAIWFAVWIDADCDVALDELEHFVEKFVDSDHFSTGKPAATQAEKPPARSVATATWWLAIQLTAAEER